MVGEHVCRDLLLSLFDLREPAVRFLEGRGVVRDDAEDIFQDALVAFQEGLHRFDPDFDRSNGRSGNGGGNGSGRGNGSRGGNGSCGGNGNGGGNGSHGADRLRLLEEKVLSTPAPDGEEVSPLVMRRARHWFWGILRNKTRAHLRGRARWVHHVPERSQDPPDHFVIRIREILDRIPSSEAEVLVLRFMHGADLALVARHCGVSVPTAHRRVKRALESARAQM
jgi:DNA-directed RNA polymerase specialized sigma24 family protein